MLDPAFYREFGNWLNGDMLDLNDWPGLLKQAKGCAIVVYDEVKDVPELIRELTDYLQNPTDELTMKLVDVSNMDWMSGEIEQKALKSAIGEIVNRLQMIIDFESNKTRKFL